VTIQNPISILHFSKSIVCTGTYFGDHFEVQARSFDTQKAQNREKKS